MFPSDVLKIADLGVALRSKASVAYESTLRISFRLARLDLSDLKTSLSFENILDLPTVLECVELA